MAMDARFFFQLKSSGFPLRSPDTEPTFSELIAACGTNLDRLDWVRVHNEWTAYSRHGMPYSGQSSEDALANLWLATKRQANRDASDVPSSI